MNLTPTPAGWQKQEDRKGGRTEILHREGNFEQLFDFQTVGMKFMT